MGVDAAVKTHYRKAFNSPYLSSADIVEPTELTIKNVTLEMDQTKKTRDAFNTAHFTAKELRDGEPLKPMILNACNSKMMKELADSPFIDDWNNIRVIIYVDPNVRFGRDTVEGLRIRKAAQVKPATNEQLAIIDDYSEAGKIDEQTIKWLDGNTLNHDTAARLILKLKEVK